MSQETLVTIHAFTSPHEAHLAKAQLESCGMEAFVFDDALVGIQPWYSHAVGGVKLRVFSSDCAEALAVLGYEDPLAEKVDRCPQCGSYDVDYGVKPRWGARFVSGLVIFLFLGLPLLFRGKLWRCNVCKHSWR